MANNLSPIIIDSKTKPSTTTITTPVQPSPVQLDSTPKSPSSLTAASQTVTTYHVNDDFPSPPPNQPNTNPLHVAAQRGDLQTVTELIESNSARPTDLDHDQITALHWSAINGHLLLSSYLISRGAIVDAFGGQLMATPLMWAARNARFQIVHLLLKNGADPNLIDSQAFNTLHLATHSSSALTLSYLLSCAHDRINIDSTDREGHTALHWACYQGDSLSVELLIAHHASVSIRDLNGMTPLHWAVVKGNANCIRQIIQAGADVMARTIEGKTPQDMAMELKSNLAWSRGLSQAGLNPNGTRRVLPLGTGFKMKFSMYMFTIICFGLGFQTINSLPYYSSIIFVLAQAYGAHHIITNTILDANRRSPGSPSEIITSSPYFSTLIVASFFWVGYAWIAHVLPHFMAAPELKKNLTELPATCSISQSFCTLAAYDSFTLSIAIWSGLQLIWTIILLGSQLWLVSKQMTTSELSNVNRFGYMGGRAGTSMAPQSSHSHSLFSSQAQSSLHSHHHSHPNHHHYSLKNSKSFLFCLKVLGLDRFLDGTQLIKKSQKAINPFNKGFRPNCLDFWSAGNHLGVNYLELYQVPEGGFQVRSQKTACTKLEVNRDRLRGHDTGSLNSRNGYERVAMDIV